MECLHSVWLKDRTGTSADLSTLNLLFVVPNNECLLVYVQAMNVKMEKNLMTKFGNNLNLKAFVWKK